MIAATKRKVLDGMNRRYIYGRVVRISLFSSLSTEQRSQKDIGGSGSLPDSLSATANLVAHHGL